ncbi:uncharacterized protein LOC134701707 [Mytilus trossulus]|uniref:uncharacterized protein LOC134701707 n=1 Tax=Mytilus trossulus TaxID=6551 RepID=UPI003005A120
MATSGDVKETELFTCAICLEQLKSPRSLPCLHTFCFQCISEYIQSSERRAGHKIANYTCPVCRSIVTPPNVDLDTTRWIESLPHNCTISSLMETTKEPNKQECHICKRKQKHSTSTKWCRDCGEAYCDECSESHNFIKPLMGHVLINIEHIQSKECGIDLGKFSDACPVHSSKVVEAYCFDHQKLCCVLCVTLQHRKCEDVQSIEDITSKTGENDTFEANLTKIQAATEQLLQEQNKEKVVVNKSLSSIENDVIDLVNIAKNKLDSLLVVFLKELKMIEENTESKLNSKLDLVEKLLNRINDFVRTTTFIRSYGSKTQLFIHIQNSKQDFNSEIEKAIMLLWQTTGLEASFLIENTLQNVMEMKSLGEVHVTEKCSKSDIKYEGLVSDYFRVPTSKMFDSVHLKRKKTVTLYGHVLTGGMCISDQTMVLCSHTLHKIIVVEISTGNIIAECVFSKNPKRLTYDTKNKTFYISFYGGFFYNVSFDQSFGKQTNIKKQSPYNGGVCIHDNHLYMVVGCEIMKMKLNQGGLLTTAFSASTDCTELNGLAIDFKSERLIHTTKDSHIVCSSLDGKKCFDYKDDQMKNVTSVTVNSRGLIFAGDETGIVHMLSDDGKHRKTLLDKCEKINRLCDIWLDKSEKTLFICGKDYVELYDISF